MVGCDSHRSTRIVLVPRILEFVLPDHSADPIDDAVGVAGDDTNGAGDTAPLVVECSSAVIEAMFATEPLSLETATAILVSDGVEPTAAEQLARAVSTIRATGSVTVLLRPIDETIHGVELTWMDAGVNGLWLTEPSSTPGRRSLERISMQQLASRLTDLLP